MAGADHLPLKFLPGRQIIGPRPPLPPTPNPNFFTLGSTMMQLARAGTSAGTFLLSIILCNTVAAFLRVSSSFDLSAPQAGTMNMINKRRSAGETEQRQHPPNRFDCLVPHQAHFANRKCTIC